MKPGPELDSLLASHVMGWIKPPETSVIKPMWVAPPLGTVYPELPKFSENITDSWIIVEKFHFVDIRKRPKGYSVEIVGKDGIVSQVENEAPLAICLAALKAVGFDGK